jgi:CRP-like cAMP-binding protein
VKKIPPHIVASLQKYLSQFGPLEPKEWEELEVHLEFVHFEKGDFLVRNDASDVKLYFIFSGFARHYFTGLDQLEITTWFNNPLSMATDYEAYTTNTRATHNIVALTNIEAVCIDRSTLYSLYSKYKNWERIGRMMNQMYLIHLMRRMRRNYTQTAKERYDEFSKLWPDVIQNALLKHIASYLGMSLETLSRIRASK